MKKLLCFLAFVMILLVVAGCNGNNDTPAGSSAATTTSGQPSSSATTTSGQPSSSSSTSANQPSNPDKPQDKEIVGVTFEDVTLTYNGNEHTLTVTGNLPSGVSVAYTNNKGTDAGSYEATAVLSGEGYITLTLNATLTVARADYDMSSAAWSEGNFTYTGTSHSVTVTGLPEGVTVNRYENNEKTASGNYTASVSFNYDSKNYNTPTLPDLKWEIKKADFAGISFEDGSFDYDGTEKMIEVQGSIPLGTDIVYACKENSALKNAAVEIGSYTVTATLTNPNFNPLTLEAELVIKGIEDERFIFMMDGVLYFANVLHEDYLYMWQNGTLTRLSTDTPYNFVEKDGKLYFRSKSLFGGAVKEINIMANGTNVDTVADAKGEYLTTDGTAFYYAVNGLTASGSGIFKLTLPQDGEPTVTQLASGKAKYLQCYNGYLYFADGANGYKLTKISTSGGNKILVRDVKISCLVQENGYLFYTVNGTLNDYIENYKIADGSYRTLTSDAGANLTVVGNKLYYINVDLLTSYLRGDGIYYVNAYPTANNQLSGSLLIGDATFSSLCKLEGGALAFYRIGTAQELLIYDLDTNSYENVLEGFTPPESIPLSTGSKMTEDKGLIYFLDLHRGKSLYSFDPVSGTANKLTATKVSDFAIIGDYLYYNTVSYGVNNDLYRINLKAGGEPEKLSTYDANDIVSDGENVFYVEKNAAGVRTAIRILAEDGSDPIIYSKGASNLRYYEGYLYFVEGENLYRMPTEGYEADAPELIRKGDVDSFEIADGVVYFRELLIINKQLSKVNVDGTGYAVLTKGYDPVDIVPAGNTVYFYSDTLKAETAGIYKISTAGGEVSCVMPKTVDGVTYYPSELVYLDGNIYFVNYALGGVGGNSHLYELNVASGEIQQMR